MKCVLLAIALTAAPLALSAETRPCPMAGQEYVMKALGTISSRWSFNKDCSEVVANFRGRLARGPVVATERGWEASDGTFLIVFSPTGKSAEVVEKGRRTLLRMYPAKPK